jgi:hypothetical protein
MSFFQKTEQEGKTGTVQGVDNSARGEDIRKGYRRVNMVQMLLYTHV